MAHEVRRRKRERIRPKTLAIAVISLLIAALFMGVFVPILILFILGAVSMVYKRRLRGIPVGFELVTLTTLIAAKAYGPGVGAGFGAVTALSAQFISGEYDAGILFFMLGAALAGFLASILPVPMPFLLILLMLIVDLATQWIPLLGAPEQKLVALVYMVTHQILVLGAWQLLWPLLMLLVHVPQP